MEGRGLSLFKVNAKPSINAGRILPLLPFIICIVAYIITAQVRHDENPKDKLVPTSKQLIDGFRRSAFEEDRKGEYRLLVDTIASTKRFAIGVAFLFLGVIIGLNMGMLPYFDLVFYKFFLFFDKIPALAILPILFIVFGLGEVSKIALIVIGVMPTIVLDTYLRAKAVPREQITKALTLDASHLEVMYRIVLPKIFPKVLETIRLNFKAVILFLIAGESLAATAGLGYRIFVVRRYIAMDIIIPYVIWISFLAFLADLAVRIWIRKKYTWMDK
ncbi:ABC transporter permease subunit [Candidatus Poribacteria bacterium]|nr:ABC transporter permease subunit [Candidatus Poribacteria bacterium]